MPRWLHGDYSSVSKTAKPNPVQDQVWSERLLNSRMNTVYIIDIRTAVQSCFVEQSCSQTFSSFRSGSTLFSDRSESSWHLARDIVVFLLFLFQTLFCHLRGSFFFPSVSTVSGARAAPWFAGKCHLSSFEKFVRLRKEVTTVTCQEFRRTFSLTLFEVFLFLQW